MTAWFCPCRGRRPNPRALQARKGCPRQAAEPHPPEDSNTRAPSTMWVGQGQRTSTVGVLRISRPQVYGAVSKSLAGLFVWIGHPAPPVATSTFRSGRKRAAILGLPAVVALSAINWGLYRALRHDADGDGSSRNQSTFRRRMALQGSRTCGDQGCGDDNDRRSKPLQPVSPLAKDSHGRKTRHYDSRAHDGTYPGG